MHGWPANYHLFEYQYNELLLKGYRCIGMDVRGFGKSDKPTYGYDYNRSADDIRCVMETLHLNNLTLLGHSTAGAVAIRYMARHNGYGVSKVVLCAAAAPSLIQRTSFPYGLKESDVRNIIQQTYRDRPKMLQDFGKIFFHNKISEPFADWFLQMGLEAASWSTTQVSYAWLSEVLFNDLAAVRVPTLILHGIHDQVCLFPLGVAMKQGIVTSTLIAFENSGHGLFYDEKDKFNRELINFVG
jgi:non-heme chloroperoxidase